MPRALPFFLTLLISLIAGIFPASGKLASSQQTGTRSGSYGTNGKWEEPGGLVNDGFRYRDRLTGTFLTRDPAGFIDGPNDYNYVRHNPWSAWDPNGLASYIVPANTAEIGYVGAPSAVNGTTTNPDAGMPVITRGATSPQPAAPHLSELLPDRNVVSAIVDAMGEPPNLAPGPTNHNADLSTVGKSSTQIRNMAESGDLSPEDSARLMKQSQSASDAEHDYEIISETTQGAAAIAQPENAVVKGATAAVALVIRGVVRAGTTVKNGVKAEGMIAHLATGAGDAAGAAANNAVPRGFASAEQFGQASAELRTALGSHGITDATIGVRGSSVTGTSFKTGQPFGPASDIDFFVESAQMTNGLKTSSSIPGFVHPDRVMKAFPELRAWSESWSVTLGRPVSPGGFVPGNIPSHPTIIAPH